MGYATGLFVGSWIENKIAVGTCHIQLIANEKNTDKIIEYLSKDQFRFFPELLFGLELNDQDAILQLNKQTIPGGVKLEDDIKIVKSKFTFNNIIGENPTTKVISL